MWWRSLRLDGVPMMRRAAPERAQQQQGECLQRAHRRAASCALHAVLLLLLASMPMAGGHTVRANNRMRTELAEVRLSRLPGRLGTAPVGRVAAFSAPGPPRRSR